MFRRAGESMIAVTGATGTIGSELVRLLAARGHPVRAISRSVARHDVPEGVEPVAADLADRSALAGAFDGSRVLFLLTGNVGDMVRLEKNALRAAADRGVERVVKLSALGASDHSLSVIGLWHHTVERELRASGMRWTILRPHHFMQNFLEPLVFDRRAGRVYSSSGEGAIPFVDTRDIAEVAVEVLTAPGHDEATYTLTGPAALSYRVATQLLSEVLGRRLDYVAESPDEAWSRRRAAGHPIWLVAAQLAIAEYQRQEGPTARTTDTIERITGRPARSLQRFFEDHADVLRRRAE